MKAGGEGNDRGWDVGCYHRLNGHEFKESLGVGDGQGGLACCSPWYHKESDTTKRLNWTEQFLYNKTCYIKTYNLINFIVSFIIFNHVTSHSQYIYMHICAQVLSHVYLFWTPQTVACQASLSMGFPSQEYWSGCHFLLEGIFPTQGLNPFLLCLLYFRQILYHWATGDAYIYIYLTLVTWLIPALWTCLVKTTHRNPGKHVSCFYIFSFSRMSLILTLSDY